MDYQTHDVSVRFAGTPFPTVALLDRPLVAAQCSLISAMLADGRVIRPFLPDENIAWQSSCGNAEKIVFPKLPWRDSSNVILDHFYLSLTYELWPDGTVFVDTFFFVEDTDAPDVQDLKLEIPLSLPGTDQLRWGFLARPATFDATVIQSSKPERFQQPGLDRRFPGEIIRQFSFDGKDPDGLAYHLELFVEGHSTLSGLVQDAETAISWNQDSPTVSWNFQTNTCSCRERPWQWRNRWGWLLTGAAKKRRLPPLRMYHYFDNYERYPTEAQVDRMKACGADVLILHENWRLDAQDGGIPYDLEQFRQVVDRAHQHGIRVAVYIRGNEDSVLKDACSWFDDLLQKDFDGLYMDYGCPFNAIRPPNEQYVGGKIDFRAHYANLRRLRERVGEHGLFFSHTGPNFSAIGMRDTINGYVSGEGERGVMIKDRHHHEYYSAACAVEGTMWTAAFPEYGSARMVPFLAAAGQYPHNALGVQFANSSLAHPRDAGINDTYLRPLWKLWGLFRDETDITVFNDYNCAGLFPKNEEIGHYLMISRDRDSALLIVTNFGERECSVECGVDFALTGFCVDQATSYKLLQSGSVSDIDKECRATLPSLGVLGLFLSNSTEKAERILQEYATSYPELNCRAHAERIAQQVEARTNPPLFDDLYLRVEVENLAVPYEESMWWDLYDNAFQLLRFDDNGQQELLGWVSKHGFVNQKPERDDYVWPGHESPWIHLNEILPPGHHKLAVHSIHLGEPFYSFVKATLSPTPSNDSSDSYEIEFLNELENDRSRLCFQASIASQIIEHPS